MKIITFSCLAVGLLCIHEQIYSQTSAIPERIRAQTDMNKITRPQGLNPGEVMAGIPPPPGEVIGDSHLEEDWIKGSILLYSNQRMIEGYPLKYDIQTDLFEIKTDADVKVLEGKRVKSFLWKKDNSASPSYFVNAHEYTFDGIPLLGFFEVLVDGSLPLFKRTEVVIQKANYVKEFDTGSRNDKILKKVSYYYGDQKEAFIVPKKKAHIIFKDKSEDLEQFIKTNDLSLKEEADLIRIFKHYNEGDQ